MSAQPKAAVCEPGTELSADLLGRQRLDWGRSSLRTVRNRASWFLNVQAAARGCRAGGPGLTQPPRALRRDLVLRKLIFIPSKAYWAPTVRQALCRERKSLNPCLVEPGPGGDNKHT